jgi:hypothetical protein
LEEQHQETHTAVSQYSTQGGQTSVVKAVFALSIITHSTSCKTIYHQHSCQVTHLELSLFHTKPYVNAYTHQKKVSFLSQNQKVCLKNS